MALVAYQILRVAVEISSAEASFDNLILEYHSEGEASFHRHLAQALRADRFFIAPRDLQIEVDPRGTVRFSLRYRKSFRILLFRLTRDLVFERETLATAS